ncbi:uncharacterized protein LOC141653677 isoform X5 [Silene latifolia]|uniref:uncharacterized protein LOC141653677 isoform X5 n=1 Tax=Silene latifolia TaxID=37657 RepID=UPI003D777890
MKGARSNRVATTEPPDDWVNGSWTVDCICGVTFDDGEEMVNCDECGVWVHTRCSRYVKGDKSFACDKCKSKRRVSSSVADAEETEVAQLLVELPTKTMRHSHHSIKMSSNNNVGSSSGCLWAERPLEDRVHVQGVPGGDVDLFSSSGSAFPVLVSSQLWKCSGYIPKRFNFRYTEFPCWENRDDGTENVAVVDKKTALPPPNSGKQNKNTLLHVSSKRFREELKDGVAKKKIKSFHKEHQPQHESKRDRLPAANTVVHATSTTTLGQGFGSKTHKVGNKAARNLEKSKQNAAADDGKFAVKSFEDSVLTTSADKSALDHTSQLRKSTRSTLKSLSSQDKDDVSVGTFIKKEQGLVVSVDESQATDSESRALTSDVPKSKPIIDESMHADSERKNTEIVRNSEAIILPGTDQCSNERKSDVPCDNPKEVLASHLDGINIKSDSSNLCEHVMSPDKECKGSKLSEVATTSKPSEQDAKDNVNGLEPVTDYQFGGNDEITDIRCSAKLECEASESSINMQKLLHDSKEAASAGQTPQPSGAAPSPRNHHKISFFGKSSSTSPAIELNSSPRVPRVPRVRNVGSLPQLPSSSAANLLMKRTSISGGKEKNTFSRRKSRDAPKDEARSSREQDSEVGKIDRVPSSPDSSKQPDIFNLAEVNTDSNARKSRISSSAASSGPLTTDAAELKSSSVNSHEDETEAHKNPDGTYRTLPGLISEIMGAGKRMAYEELCDVVLPHWPHLRKHNGERYAYSTHSQAVLDCLRNRAEWARLVDRGPKTSSSRRKRKIDAELLSSESEDENHKDGESKSFESNKEEFPKGRRNARKRRGLALQGRSVQDGQKKRKVEVGSSCDSGSFSNSSEDSVSSQDDSQGSEMDVANTEVSASSQEMGAMS